jgi:hypothetical protein
MTTKFGWLGMLRGSGRALLCGLAGGLMLAGGFQARAQDLPRAPVSPQALPESGEGFYDIDQLERLFQIARDSGFTEQEIREITIEDELGNAVNAWDYLQEVKRRRSMRDKADQEKLTKIYLTVQDILADLGRREKDDLRKLRDQSVFGE